MQDETGYTPVAISHRQTSNIEEAFHITSLSKHYELAMGFFRQYIAPLFIVLIFAVALLAVSARIFLPSDMMAPAPINEPISGLPNHLAVSDLAAHNLAATAAIASPAEAFTVPTIV